jgi:hypothetical protein
MHVLLALPYATNHRTKRAGNMCIIDYALISPHPAMVMANHRSMIESL